MTQLDDGIRQFLEGRRVASIATKNSDNTIHLVAVWYLFEQDAFYIATPSWSRTGQNLKDGQTATIMVDQRGAGFEKGVSAIGTVSHVQGRDANLITKKIFSRYIYQKGMEDPEVGPVFVASNDLTTIIEPTKWVSWDMPAMDTEVFGGRLQRESYLIDLDK